MQSTPTKALEVLLYLPPCRHLCCLGGEVCSTEKHSLEIMDVDEQISRATQRLETDARCEKSGAGIFKQGPAAVEV